MGLALLSWSGTARGGDPWRETLKTYEKAMSGFTSMGRRTSTRRALANTRDARAMKVLQKEYKKAEHPKLTVQYLLAGIAGMCFQDVEHENVWSSWLGDATRNEDAWLWFHGSFAPPPTTSAATLLARCERTRSPFVRAASLEGLSGRFDASAIDAVEKVLTSLPSDALKRGLMVSAAADWLASGPKPHRITKGKSNQGAAHPPRRRAKPLALTKDQRKSISLSIVQACKEGKLPEWAALSVGRALAAAWKFPHVSTDWHAVMLAIESESTLSASEDRYGRPRFAGIEASGKRICYVIDMSDSMLRPLTDAERKVIRTPVTTGGDGKQPKTRSEFDELPWNKIHTRFDVAREFVKLSLRGLSKEQSFAVVYFGTQAGLIKSSKGMVPATKGTVSLVVRQLDKIKAKSATKTRPHGRLRDATNLHGGLARAFRVVRRGLLKEPEYCSVQGLEEGCDTIFLLSDGAPTADDYEGRDMCKT